MKYVLFRTITDMRVPLHDNGGYGNAELVRSFTKIVDENGGYAPKAKKKAKVQKELTATAEEDFEM